MSSTERLARLRLAHIIEAGDPVASVLVSTIGAEHLLALIGRPPPVSAPDLPVDPNLPASPPDLSVDPALPVDPDRLALRSRPGNRRGSSSAERPGLQTGSGVLPARLVRWRLRAAAAPSGPEAYRDLHDRRLAFLIPGDPEWPVGLAEVRPGLLDAAADTAGCAAPIGLFCAGDPAQLQVPAVAVVGRRAASSYGCAVARDLAGDLAAAGWRVISGAAYGIDAAAHAGALAVDPAGTLAVTAGGLDEPYPRGHADLLERLRSTSLVCSEYPPQAHPTRSRFLARNRLIAALAVGTVIVQAEHRSGALNTARWARDCGRLVMGVPGPVTDPGSAGVHRLIAEGQAQLVTGAADVIELCSRVGEGLSPVPVRPVRATDRLSGASREVHEVLHRRRGASIATIAGAAGVAPMSVLAALGALELAGLAHLAADGWRAGRGCATGDPDLAKNAANGGSTPVRDEALAAGTAAAASAGGSLRGIPGPPPP